MKEFFYGTLGVGLILAFLYAPKDADIPLGPLVFEKIYFMIADKETECEH